MPRFKVGDAVRVKAGVPERKACESTPWGLPYLGFTGIRLTIKGYREDGNSTLAEVRRNEMAFDLCHEAHLEPWNDAEEWNGAAWVKKQTAKPAIVVRRDCVSLTYVIKCDSTNEAWRKARELAEKYPGTEYVVYQEKGSEKVVEESVAEKIARRMKEQVHVELTHVGSGVKQWLKVESAEATPGRVTITYKVPN